MSGVDLVAALVHVPHHVPALVPDLVVVPVLAPDQGVRVEAAPRDREVRAEVAPSLADVQSQRASPALALQESLGPSPGEYWSNLSLCLTRSPRFIPTILE